MKIDALSQTSQGAAAGLLVALMLSHGLFKASRKHGAYRRAFLGGKYACLAQKFGVDL